MRDETPNEVVIIGAGVAGLACARVLEENDISFTVLEKSDSPGGRIQTDYLNGYQLDHGFQVLQTGYPDIDHYLALESLDLAAFPSGVAVRYDQQFHIVADPRRHLKNFYSTIASPIGTIGDRFKLLRLVGSLVRRPMADIFEDPEEPALQFLKQWGFSERFIQSFFTPFFAGACLDPSMKGSSRVLKYVTRLFSTGDAALPAGGMAAIPRQIAASLPTDSVVYGQEVIKVEEGAVTLADTTVVRANQIVVAVPQPACARILKVGAPVSSVGEACVYFSSEWRPPLPEPFLVLNGEGAGPVNNIAFPSLVASTYAPPGKTLIAAVVLGNQFLHRDDLEDLVREQCGGWFGAEVDQWEHIKTHRIHHALPDQSPPTANPYEGLEQFSPGITICGEQTSLPGLQWAIMSGAMAGRSVAERLGD